MYAHRSNLTHSLWDEDPAQQGRKEDRKNYENNIGDTSASWYRPTDYRTMF